MSINNLGQPDYDGQIYALGQRVQKVEVTVSGVAISQASYNARLTALEQAGTGPGGPVYWPAVLGKPTTLAGYGIVDAVTTFNQLSGKPTTLVGYGITDAQSATGAVGWSRITSTPTTLAGYGITDAQGSAAPVAWSRITGTPTTRAGYGITDAQPLDGDLTSLASASATGALYYRSAADTWAPVTIGANLTFSAGTLAAAGGSSGGGDMLKSDNLSGLANYATARSNLGLGTLATQSGTFSGASSGTNTGDQTSVTGNAGTATKLLTARTINGVSFDGTANVTVAAVDTVTPRLALTHLPLTVNFTAAADAYIPARVAQTIAQGNAPIGTGTLAYAKSTAAQPSTFTTTTLPTTLEAGAWLKVSASAVTGFVAADLYRSA